MWSVCRRRAWKLGLLAVALAVGIMVPSVIESSARVTKDKAAKTGTPSAPEAAVPVPPLVRDTKTNLQTAFSNETNAKERYNAFAKVADREGFAAVARLFRACAQAEQIHAARHVSAIAWTGGEARALLERLAVGTTAENLETAIAAERYEAEQLYPAYLARARAERWPAAVRSMNFALSAEREHLRLLESARATLEQCPTARAIYVCPYCGKTVESRDFDKCPNCFTGAGKFISVS